MALTQITEKGIKDGEIVNADVNASAAIAKSKLASLDIVNADINASAAIAGSKLAAATTSVAGSMSAADKTKLDGVAASANNYTHPNHTGEVTSTADGATVIASNIVDEDNLKISNAGSNGQFLSKQSGDTGGLTWATVSTAASFRNLIINGAMQVAQRGTSSTATGYGSVDRYKVEGSGTGQTCTHSQQSLSSSDTGPWEVGFRNYMRLAFGSAGTANAGAWVGLEQRIEAQNVANSGWDYTSASSDITLSFWFRASTNQTFYGYVYSYDGTAQAYTFSFTATGNNTWTKVTHTIPGNSNITVDNNNEAGLQIMFLPFIGTNYTNNKTLNTWAAHSGSNYCPDMASTWLTTGTPTFDVTGVQLEVGDTASDFEHRGIGDELARCQRYFYRHVKGDENGGTNAAIQMGATSYNNSWLYVGVALPVTMRATPALEVSNTTNGFIFYAADSNGGFNTFGLDNASTPKYAVLSANDSFDSGKSCMVQCNAAASYMQFNAEL